MNDDINYIAYSRPQPQSSADVSADEDDSIEMLLVNLSVWRVCFHLELVSKSVVWRYVKKLDWANKWILWTKLRAKSSCFFAPVAHPTMILWCSALCTSHIVNNISLRPCVLGRQFSGTTCKSQCRVWSTLCKQQWCTRLQPIRIINDNIFNWFNWSFLSKYPNFHHMLV